MHISQMWAAWSIAGPWRLSPLLGGTNNLMWRADAADGHSYVLRLSADLSRAPRMRYEAQLLQALEDQHPPFRLPVPLTAMSGDGIVPYESEQGTRMIATLSLLLPGNLEDLPPERHELLSASQAASTLAWLDTALASLPDLPLPDGYIPLPTFGERAHWHALVPDPLAAVERLPVDREQIRQIRAFLTEVLESVPGLYATLPQQVLHRDYDPSNILLDQHRVTAV